MTLLSKKHTSWNHLNKLMRTNKFSSKQRANLKKEAYGKGLTGKQLVKKIEVFSKDKENPLFKRRDIGRMEKALVSELTIAEKKRNIATQRRASALIDRRSSAMGSLNTPPPPMPSTIPSKPKLQF